MKWLFALVLVAITVVPSWAAQAPAASSKKTKSHGRYARGRRSRRKAAASYQLHPDPQRYQEIQKALADRGYFKGEANGQWGDDSIDALKRFQADQKLTDDGKINSLSLIGLGLGPKHDGSAVTPANSIPAPLADPPPAPASQPDSSISPENSPRTPQ